MVYDKLLNTVYENEENLQETFTIEIGPKVKKPSHNFRSQFLAGNQSNMM